MSEKDKTHEKLFLYATLLALKYKYEKDPEYSKIIEIIDRFLKFFSVHEKEFYKEYPLESNIELFDVKIVPHVRKVLKKLIDSTSNARDEELAALFGTVSKKRNGRYQLNINKIYYIGKVEFMKYNTFLKVFSFINMNDDVVCIFHTHPETKDGSDINLNPSSLDLAHRPFNVLGMIGTKYMGRYYIVLYNTTGSKRIPLDPEQQLFSNFPL